jgi:hypothetical protein
VTGSSDQTVGLWRLHNGNPISTMTVGMSVIEVNMAKHNDQSSSPVFDNHTYYCLDSMANVSVFRNSDLLTDIHKSIRALSIEGVGSKMTKVDQVGAHPLFGEVWYLPANEYNIVSQWQAEKQGFLLKILWKRS